MIGLNGLATGSTTFWNVYGIIYFIPGFGGIALAKYFIREREFELEIAKQDLEEAKENYNREKYWWMRAK